LKKYSVVLVLFIIPLSVFSQEFNYVFEPDSIPVEIQGWNPYCPFSGGDSQTTPELCDIDADGDLDFFWGNYGGKVSFFENDGTNNEPDYELITKDFAGVDLSGNTYAGRTTPEFCDLDGDRDLDLFTGDGRGLIHYWENIGSSMEPEFQWITDSLEYIVVAGQNTIELKDLDYDGDYDLFIGDYYGNIVYYRNDGNTLEWDFVFITEDFEGIDVSRNASPCFIDIDNDNDRDLFIGDKYGEIWYYRNDGDSVNYDYTYVTDNYAGIDVGSYSSPEFADIDNDGDYDLFIGSGGRTYYYENIGTPENPQFDYITDSYMTFEPGWLVQVVDINGDDAPDLFAGYSDYLSYSENIGFSVNPAYLFIDDTFQDITRSAIFPCFVDIDADGDYDLLAGEGVFFEPPTIALYINNGIPTEPSLSLVNENYITNNNWDVCVNPCVADIDTDGDFDLFVTTNDYYLYYYCNEGTPSNPDFTLINSQWQGIYLTPMWRGMSFGDIDEDGDLDLLISNVWETDYSNLRFYRNIGTPQVADMVLETNVFLPGFELPGAYPYLVDIDSDNDLDLFVGDHDDGVSFFRNHGYGGLVLTLTPHNTPIQIQPGGGFFTFDVEVENISATNYIIDFITDATLPNGSNYPIFLRSNVVLDAGVTLIRENMIQSVPGRAPSGDYSYNAYVRDHATQDTLTTDSFSFEKLESMDVNIPWVFDWGLSGWDDEVSLNNNNLPEFFSLSAYPNPFNAETTIKLHIPHESKISVRVFNTNGQEIAVLKDGYVNAGYLQYKWDAEGFSSGVYLINLHTENTILTRKCLLLK